MKKNILIRNSISGLLQVILTAVLAFASVPIFINKLGMELYGIFAIISIVGNLNSLANFGLNGALMIYISKQGKSKQSDNDIAATIVFMSLIIITITIFAFAFKNYILNQIFAIPKIHLVEASDLFILLIISNSLLLFGQTGTAIIDACQKVYVSNISQFVYSLLYWGGVIIVVLSGGKLKQIGVAILFSASIWFSTVVFFAYRIWGKIDLSDFSSNFSSSLKKQISYGSKIYFSGLVAFLFEPLSKILLSNFIDLRAVAMFEIGYKIKSQINSLIAKSLYPLLPFIASNSGTVNFKQKLYDFSKKIQLFVIPFSIVLLFCFPILMKLWLGENSSTETTVFVIVMTTSMLLFSPAKIPIYQYLLANNHAGKAFIIQSISALVNIIIFFLFKASLGVYAILMANSIAFFSSYLICNYYQIRFLGIARLDLLKDEFILVLMFIFSLFINFIIFRLKSIALIDLLIYPLSSYLIFVIFIKVFHLFSKEDSALYFGSFGRYEANLRTVLWLD